jgi:TonB family protein
MSEVWEKWQDQVINGVFPLRRLLGCTDHSGVFLTVFAARNLPDAALKLIPAAAGQADTQLALWKAAAALTHPHLVRLFEVGRCDFEGLPFIFVVMEYAEQTLAQLLLQRALTADEVPEMLRPTLSSLRFLHDRQRVQGALKPSNILVVGDQLRLASDTIRAFGDPADDIWNLGVTLVEALTQHPSAWINESFDAAALPATFPEPFASLVRQCLNRTPADRPTVADLETQLGFVPPSPLSDTPVHRSALPQSPVPNTPPTRVPAPKPKQRLLATAFAVVLVSLIVWAVLRSRHSPPPTPAVMTTADAVPAASPAGSLSTDHPAIPAPKSSRGILHEEIPDISRSARGTIRGRIKVAVRVTVDSAGDVTRAALEKPGTSKYFDHVATQAAGKWKFAPADRDSQQWLLRFEFSRSSTDAYPGIIQPQPP